MKKREKAPRSVGWIFNYLMLWGAVLGFFIFGAVGTIQDTWRHKGPGSVFYEEPDRLERLSENEYKRHKYTMGAGMLILGLGIWIYIANIAKKEEAKRAFNENCLDAKTKIDAAYHAAFAKVMGTADYQSVAAKAMKDPAYQAAKASEEAKIVPYAVAYKTARGLDNDFYTRR